MPRNYKRKTTRGQWSEDSMKAALEAVKNGKAYKKASKEFSVPIMSLKRRAKEKNKVAVDAVKYLGGKKTVFTEAQENEMINHIKDMETRMYRLTKRDVLSLAYQLAVKNNIAHPFKGEKAGNDWLKGFRQRHPDITLRAPESNSTARARAFNKPVVDKFFSTLKNVQNAKNIPAHRIYNVDETSICTVPTKNTKVFAGTGRKQIARVTSAERGVTTTAVICMSASGTFVPPMFIFRRIRMKIELMDGAPPGSVWACNASGWMKLEVFSQWFDHFVHHTKPSEEDPVMLILDGHLSHTKNLDVILKARENHITIVCLPPHCTHKLQPLDVSFMYPLSAYHNQALEKWINTNPGIPVTVFQIAKIFGEAYLKAAIPNNAVSGFAKTGIFPFDADVFTEVDYIAAATTENELDNEEIPELPEPARTPDVLDIEMLPCAAPESEDPAQLPLPLLDNNDLDLILDAEVHKTPSPTVDEPVPVRSPLSPLPSTSRAASDFDIDEREVGVITEEQTGLEDPLANNSNQQCRFCGKNANTSINPTDKLYSKDNKISLTLNDIHLEIDLNDTHKVCLKCDRKLSEWFNFVRMVKNSQDALLNDSFDEETETLVVKTECESPTPDDYDEIEDVKEEIVDSITIDETVVKQKRKCNKDTKRTTKRQKKPNEDIKVKSEDTELIMDIKEETIEKDDDANTKIQKSADLEDTEPDEKPSELDIATNALLNEMAGDGFS